LRSRIRHEWRSLSRRKPAESDAAPRRSSRLPAQLIASAFAPLSGGGGRISAGLAALSADRFTGHVAIVPGA
jgi:hypothetical protein